ncbi:MAG: hypothetical protein AB8G86_02970 [Saprospiraceae bacterium]
MILLNLGDWWIALSGPHQAFWGISIVFSILFLIQFVFSLIGLDADADIDGDMDMSGDMDMDPGFGMDADFTVFSVRSIIAFFTFFGWTGVLVLNAGGDVLTALGFSFLSGTVAMLIVGYLIYLFSKLSEDGNIDMENALLNTGEVYLTIPGEEGGQGKIHITINNSFREINAVTKNFTPLPTGSKIRVIEIIEDNLLLVEPIEDLLE